MRRTRPHPRELRHDDCFLRSSSSARLSNASCYRTRTTARLARFVESSEWRSGEGACLGLAGGDVCHAAFGVLSEQGSARHVRLRVVAGHPPCAHAPRHTTPTISTNVALAAAATPALGEKGGGGTEGGVSGEVLGSDRR